MTRNLPTLPGAAGLCALLCLGALASGATFDEQRAAAMASIETQAEPAVRALLRAGIEESRPTQAAALAAEWLRHNLPQDPGFYHDAGRNAELAADFRGAVALYQQFLGAADPKSAEAGDAITAIHALLVHELNDPGAAFVFGINQAPRLAVNPRFRQWDRWFLDTARAQQDLEAAAVRLLATARSGVSDDLMTALHGRDLRWLQEAIRQARYDQGRFSPELVATVKELAKTIRSDEELGLLLDWSISVKAYNMARIDGGDIAPPLAEAKALLERFPRHAERVQTDWAGGHNGQHYRDDPKKYWPHDLEAKLAPVRAAIPKLSPIEEADLMRTWSGGHYAGGPSIFTPEEARAWVLENPERANRRTAPALAFDWEKLSLEDARKLAPALALNPSPEAVLVRAIVAAGEEKNLDKALDAILGPEAWRLGPAELDGRYADRLWHWAGRPGDTAKRDQGVARSKELLARIQAETVGKDTPADRRLAVFRQLWGDYRSGQPKTPALVSRLRQVLSVTPEAVPELLRDSSVEAAVLLRDALAADFDPPLSGEPNVRGLSPDRYDPFFERLLARHRNDIAFLERQNLLRPHPLEPELRKTVADRLAKNQLESWLVLAWLNAQFPADKDEASKLAAAIAKSPSWTTLSSEARQGLRSAFAEGVMPPGQLDLIGAADPALACKDLLALPADPDAATAGKALQAAVDALLASPVRIDFPDGALEKLDALTPEEFADAAVLEPFLAALDRLKTAQVPVEAGNRLVAHLTASRDPRAIDRSVRFLWQHVNRHMRSFEPVKKLTDSLLEEQPSSASALARTGLEAIARHRGHTFYNRETDIPLLKSIRGRAALQMGLVVIPVPKGHAAYPVYQSQAEWTTGNEDSAWTLLDGNWEAFLPVHREMSVSFLLWVLQQTIYNRAEERQEELVKALLGWAGEAGSPLTPVEKIRIELAYGDIAVQRGQLREAHEIFRRTESNEAWQELPIRHQATLRRAAAERLAKDFDGALETLGNLELERIPELWSDIRYARAEVFFDMEEFDDAKEDIDAILAREPNHPDARILLGKVQLKRQKLMEATEVELGSNTAQDSLVPGEKLKVTLNDPTLAVSGAGTEIEVRVWAVSGDQETFFLRQFGDQKTKFRGEVATALGAPAPGDGTLQVIGDDEVFYAYTERFLEKMNLVDEKRGGPIVIASDALLMASARKLLTEAEQRTADMEAVMDQIRISSEANAEAAARAAVAARALDAEARAAAGGITEDDFSRHLANVAKPGNPVHVRVIDPDRSRTAEVDELTVAVSTSSGDSVSRVTLRETGTHTGWFEGSIPTKGAQAMAFAENSEPGRNPNMVISPNDEYPDWRPTTKSDETHRFTIDLNDNVPVGAMTLTAREPEARLQRFLVQTAMNPSQWTTVASHPAGPVGPPDPWRPSVIVMNDTDEHHHVDKRSVYDLPELQQHVEGGWLNQTYAAGIAENVAGPSEAMTASIPAKVTWQRQGRHHNAHVVYRFRGYFHEPRDVVRRFKLDLGKYQVPEGTHPSVANPPQFLLAVDGRPITDPERPDRLEGEIKLRPGIHRFEIWATGWDCAIGFGRTVRLSANLEEPEGWVDCPDSFFDPAGFPEGSHDLANGPATLAASEDGTTFTVNFGPGSRARLLRFVITGHEGPVPALNKITLTRPDGSRVLPVDEDFASLNRNETLEMLTGDRISVRYVDDRFVTKEKEKHERFLDVAFTDAGIEFADIEPRVNPGTGKPDRYYERLLRFLHDRPLPLVVNDADMDVSGEPDTVEVQVKVGSGEARAMKAVETGDSTGVFRLFLTPVAGPAAADDQLSVPVGGTITVAYLDRENNRPGVPAERLATISHAAFVEPEFHLAHATVTPWKPEPGAGDGMQTLVHGFHPVSEATNGNRPEAERVRMSWQVANAMLPAGKSPEGGFAAVHGRSLSVELVAPHLALGSASEVRVYAQTDAGRRAAGVTGDGPFNVTVPGTIELKGNLSPPHGRSGIPALPIYHGGEVWSLWAEPRTDRFHFSIPLVAGMLPPFGVISDEEREELEKRAKDSRSIAEQLEISIRGLVVQPGENIHLGFSYTGGDGSVKWATARTRVVTHPVFDLMSEDWRDPVTSAYVGESLHLRVVDLGADTSDEIDTVSVLVQAKSGAKANVELHESGPHTGIFKGEYQLGYAKQPGALAEDHDIRREGFPVIYGDTVAARYTDANGVKTDTLFVTISKGADGWIRPFSKTYEDETVAMRTQFSLAEAYLEIAKRHRKLGDEALAEQEYSTAKLLLGKAMDQFRDPDTRAHAEYLLGSLTLEEALATEDPEARETRFRAALSRFMTVTGSYPQTIHASRAQYRIATVYEALQEPEIAAQEYVKLAYKYPDSEFLATSMARLGSHFLKTAAAYEAKAKPLLARAEEDKDAAYEGEALQKMAVQEYLKTASIFGRLQERFPDHELAGDAGLRAGQAYMRAGRNAEAVEAFQRVLAEEGYDGPKVRAQAIYWSGMCYQALRQEMAAYSAFKRLTYDFPESEWAAYARAQLSTDRLLDLENRLELERLEAEQ